MAMNSISPSPRLSYPRSRVPFNSAILFLVAGTFLLVALQSSRSLFASISPAVRNIETVKEPIAVPCSKDESYKEELLEAKIRFQTNLARREDLRKDLHCKEDEREKDRTCYGNYGFIYLVPTYQCPRDTHVGEWGEGGKWICNFRSFLEANKSVVYSIGSNGVESFERTMFDQFGIVTHTFDPTLPRGTIASLQSARYLHLHEIGLTGEANQTGALEALRAMGVRISPNAEMLRIDEIMGRLGHGYVHVLKIDCEGCEVSFIHHLSQISVREKPLFGQMLFEFHHTSKMILSMTLFDILNNLGYHLFHEEPNFRLLGRAWEMAFVHESLMDPL